MLSTDPFECPACLLDRARAARPVRAAVTAAGAPLAIESARLAAGEGVIEPVLVGDAAVIRRLADAIRWDIAPVRVVDTGEDERRAAEASAALARGGEVGAIMKGHIHTDAFMGALVRKEAGLRTDRMLSHVFHMTVPGSERVLMISDGAVIVRPDLDTKRHIIRNAVDFAHAVGNRAPKVALLSATEEPNPKMPSSVHAVALSEWAAEALRGRALVHGPLALDNAVSPEAARIKGIEHPVAGNADVLVVPDIKTGNALFKMMVYFRSACAAGLVMGARVPIMLTSRADPPEARLASACLAALVAAAAEAEATTAPPPPPGACSRAPGPRPRG